MTIYYAAGGEGTYPERACKQAGMEGKGSYRRNLLHRGRSFSEKAYPLVPF